MKWYKSFSDEDESSFVGSLISEFGLRGYYFYKRTLSLMAKHFDVSNPGCNKFNKYWFFQQYHPIIKDQRTILKIMEFMQSNTETFYYFENNSIILYWPDLERRADNYTLKALKDMADNDKELPLNAGLLHESCRRHAQKITYELYKNAKEGSETKRHNQDNVQTNYEDCVRSFSVSSSRKGNYSRG